MSYGLFVLSKASFYGDSVPGHPSLMAVVLFLGGLQLLALEGIGEYLGRMFIESKQRPIYLLNDQSQAESVSNLPLVPSVPGLMEAGK